MIEFTLPWPPSSNTLYPAGSNQRRHLSKKGKEYHFAVCCVVLQAKDKIATKGRLAVEIDLYPPDMRKRDIANAEKCIVDSLVEAGVMEDDCLIDLLTIRRCRLFMNGGKAVVRISSYVAD